MSRPALGLYLNLWERHATWTEVLRIARAAEDAGFAYLAVPEAFGRDGFTLCDRLLAGTSRIEVALALANVFSRSPAVLAQTAATLDELSGGRFVLGLGASTPNLVEGWHGAAYARPLERLRDTAAACRHIWRREKGPWPGRTFAAGGVRLGFTPLRPEIPIWFGSVMPKSIVLAAEVADGWVPYMLPRPALAERVELIRSAARDRADGGPAVVPIVALATDAEQMDEFRRVAAIYVGPPNSPYAELLGASGYGGAVASIVAAYAEGGGTSAAAQVTDDLLDAVGLVGPVATTRAKLEGLAAAGADAVLVWPVKLTYEAVEPLLRAVS